MGGNKGSFATYRKDVNDPRWGEEGLIAAQVIGGEQDAECGRLRQAALCRLPIYCPNDGLDLCGVGFQIPRYPGESDDSYRARLINAFPSWLLAGSGEALVVQLQAYGFGDVFILPVWQSPAPFYPETSDTNYAEFYIFLGPDFGTTGVATSLSTAQLAAVRGIVLKWKDAGSVPIKVVLQTSGTAGAPTTASGASYPIGTCLGDTQQALGSAGRRLGGYILT